MLGAIRSGLLRSGVDAGGIESLSFRAVLTAVDTDGHALEIYGLEGCLAIAQIDDPAFHPAFIPRPQPTVGVHLDRRYILTCAFVHRSPPQRLRPAFGTLRSSVRIRPSRLQKHQVRAVRRGGP